jgi:hypothetical protein
LGGGLLDKVSVSLPRTPYQLGLPRFCPWRADPNEPEGELFLKPAYWVQAGKSGEYLVSAVYEQGILLNARDIIIFGLVSRKVRG